jgi:type II secretory pathway component PulM
MEQGWRGQYTRYKEFFLNIAFLYKQRTDLRAFLEVILSLSTVIIFLLFALKPTALTIISLFKEIKEKRATVAVLNQKINDLKTANSVFAQNQNFIPDVENSVATSPKPNIVVQQVEGIAIKNSIDLLGVSIGQMALVGTVPAKESPADVKPLPENTNNMSISINVKGSFPNLLSFIKDVENLRVTIKIDSIDISSSETDTEQVIEVVISGRVPYLNK